MKTSEARVPPLWDIFKMFVNFEKPDRNIKREFLAQKHFRKYGSHSNRTYITW